MKKNFIILSLVMMFSIGAVMAEGMVFDPTEYNQKPAPPIGVDVPTAQNPNELAKNTITSQSQSFDNALFELDTAQVNIRNQMLEYKAKYQEIDTQYKLIKAQRSELDKQIKTIEKRIKQIENNKNNIRKTMSFTH